MIGATIFNQWSSFYSGQMLFSVRTDGNWVLNFAIFHLYRRKFKRTYTLWQNYDWWLCYVVACDCVMRHVCDELTGDELTVWRHEFTDDTDMSKHRLPPYKAYYHNWQTLNFTASNSSSVSSVKACWRRWIRWFKFRWQVFLESVNSTAINVTSSSSCYLVLPISAW